MIVRNIHALRSLSHAQVTTIGIHGMHEELPPSPCHNSHCWQFGIRPSRTKLTDCGGSTSDPNPRPSCPDTDGSAPPAAAGLPFSRTSDEPLLAVVNTHRALWSHTTHPPRLTHWTRDIRTKRSALSSGDLTCHLGKYGGHCINIDSYHIGTRQGKAHR